MIDSKCVDIAVKTNIQRAQIRMHEPATMLTLALPLPAISTQVLALLNEWKSHAIQATQ